MIKEEEYKHEFTWNKYNAKYLPFNPYICEVFKYWNGSKYEFEHFLYKEDKEVLSFIEDVICTPNEIMEYLNA